MDTLLVLDLCLDVVNCVRRFDLERDGLASQRLDKNLHTTAETKNEVERALLLDVVVGEGAAILELFTSKDQALLIRRNALLVLNLGLNVVDRVGRLDLESDRLACERLQEALDQGGDYNTHQPLTFTKICMPPRRRKTVNDQSAYYHSS